MGAPVGLGYELAWARRCAEAESTFREAVAVAPGNPGAAKGLAWVYLGSGRRG